MIRVESLFHSFDTPKGPIEVLKGVSFSVNAGEILGIYGPSGAGKTTLLRCLTLIQRPKRGRVLFDGKEVYELSKEAQRDLRRRISLVYQGFNLLASRNAIQNVSLPLEIQGFKRSQALDRALTMLSLVGIEKRSESFPESLSGGEKQRVAIARALVTQPEILVMDEPTSSLDEKTALSILSLIEELRESKALTVILVTHQVELVNPICQRAFFLENGVLMPFPGRVSNKAFEKREAIRP